MKENGGLFLNSGFVFDFDFNIFWLKELYEYNGDTVKLFPYLRYF